MVKIAKSLISRAEETPCYWQLGNLWQVMATGVQTDNAFTLIDQMVAPIPGGGPLTHAHVQDEGLYVISGKCTFNAGGLHGLQGTSGSLVVIPGNCEHSFTVDEPGTRILNFYLPAGFEQILIGLAHPAPRRELPPQDKIMDMLPERWLADKLADDYGNPNILGNPWMEVPTPEQMRTKPTPGASVFPFITSAETAPFFTALNGCWAVLASGPQTGGSYCMFEVTYDKGIVFEPRMYGLEKDEMFYVLAGDMTFLLGDRIEQAHKGDFIYVPSRTLYSARVDSGQARFLNLHTRSGFEELVSFFAKSAESAGPLVDYRGKSMDQGAYGRLLSKIGLQYIKVPNPLS